MVTLADMEKHYNDEVPYFTKEWKRITPTRADEYAAGVAEVLGITPERVAKTDEWKRGIGAVSLEDLRSAVEGKGGVLAKHYEEVMSA